MTQHISFTPVELVDTNRGDAVALDFRVDTPFRLGGEAQDDDFQTPWANWGVDRAFVVFPQDDHYSEGLTEEASQDNATSACQQLQEAYDFDGEIFFISASHAEHFWSFLLLMSKAAVAGEETFEFEGETIDAHAEDLECGDSPLALFGRPTNEGLWILFMESDVSFGTPWVKQAFKSYPRHAELEVTVDAMDGSAFVFDPAKVSSFCATHLMSAVEGHLRGEEDGEHEGEPVFLKAATQQ